MEERQSALIIANSRYEDAALRQLLAPVHDAEDLARVLQDPAIGNFDVTTVLDQPSYKIKQQIQAFFSARRREDLLLLYFSGHGIKDEDGKLYFAAVDTQQKLLQATGVEASFINEMMRKSMSRRQILLLDCCHSGAFARGMVAKAGTPVGTWENLGGRGRVVLTASDAMQYSFECNTTPEKASMSIFTGTLVQGLASGEADLDGDGLVSLDELYTYVHDKIQDLTPNQTPTKWELDVEGKIIIARSPASRLQSAELPDDVGEAVASRFPSVREDAIHELDRLLRGKHKGLALAAERALRELTKDDSRRVSSAAEACLKNSPKEKASQPNMPVPPAQSVLPDLKPDISVDQEKLPPPPPPPSPPETREAPNPVQQQANESLQEQKPQLPASLAQRPLSVRRLLGWTFKLYFGKFFLFVGIAAVIPLLNIPLYLWRYWAAQDLFLGNQHSSTDGTLYMSLVLYTTVYLTSGALAARGTTNAILMLFVNKKSSALGTLKSEAGAWRWFAGYLLIAFVVSGVAVTLLFPMNRAIDSAGPEILVSLAVIIGATYLLARTILCANVFAVQRVNVAESMRQSFSLSRGVTRRIWFFLVLFFVLNWTLTLLALAVITNFIHMEDSADILLLALLWSFWAAVTTPLLTIPVSLIYFDQRGRKEGVYPEGLLNFLGQAQPPEPSAARKMSA